MKKTTYQAEELKKRSKQFAIRVIRLFQALPKSDVARVLGRQLLRSGTAVAANYRAVCRARLKAEFIAKIGVVVEEIDESVLWLELLVETDTVPLARMESLLAGRMPFWPYSQPPSIPPEVAECVNDSMSQ
jgi:four helix bundle protein